MKLNKILHNVEYDGNHNNQDITYITHDSRRVKKGTLYIALKGLSCDGHDYIFDAIEKGAVAIIANGRAPDTNIVPIIQVKNPRKTMSIIAANFFDNPSKNMKIIGITGTNGKTTTTQIINHILNKNDYNSGSLGTLGFDTPTGIKSTNFTTPESIDLQHILKIMKNGGIGYVPMEVSSHAIEMNRIDNININIAIFTNLGTDHLDFHKNKENYFNAKLKLFKKLNKSSTSIINADDKYCKRILSNIKSKKYTYGFNKNADIYISKYEIDYKKTKATIVYLNKEYYFETELIGKFNLYNILAAISCCVNLNLNIKSVIKSIESFHSVPGRFQKFNLPNNKGIAIVDYAHSPDAYDNIFKNIKLITNKKIITIFGCGGNRDKNKRPLMGNIVEKYSDEIIITNDNPRNENQDDIINNIISGFEKTTKYMILKDRKLAIHKAINISKNNIILILGKGIEEYQLIKNKKIPHSDIAIIEQYIYENRN